MTPATRIYVNLPVKNLKASTEFFSKLGLPPEREIAGTGRAHIVIGENVHAVLLPAADFLASIPNAVCDTNRFTEAIVGFTVPTRAKVDEIVRNAVLAGGMIYKAPEDDGTRYGQSFQDLDGHIWEVMTVEPAPAGIQQQE